MKRLTAIITFACFLSVSTAEGRVLTVFVKIGCSVVMVPATRPAGPTGGCCSPFNYEYEVYRCVPFSKPTVTLKNMIEYKKPNSITARGSDELSTPIFNAVLGNPRDISPGKTQVQVSEAKTGYSEKFINSPVFENLVFIHPQISITVLRL